MVWEGLGYLPLGKELGNLGQETGMKTVLVVVAHADDMEFMAGGTVYRLIREKNYPVYELILTDNRRGSYTLGEGEVVKASKNEAIEAGGVLGLREVRFLDFPDGELGEVPVKILRDKIIDIVREVKANLVMSWDPFAPGEDHPDHRITAIATYEACSFSSNPNFGTKGLYPLHFVSEAMWFAKKPMGEQIIVDITGEPLEKKIEALLKHETQMQLAFDSLMLEAKCVGISLPGLESLSPDQRNMLIANGIRKYTEEVGKKAGFQHAEQFRYEKFGLLETVLGQELISPDFPPVFR